MTSGKSGRRGGPADRAGRTHASGPGAPRCPGCADPAACRRPHHSGLPRDAHAASRRSAVPSGAPRLAADHRDPAGRAPATIDRDVHGRRRGAAVFRRVGIRSISALETRIFWRRSCGRHSRTGMGRRAGRDHRTTRPSSTSSFRRRSSLEPANARSSNERRRRPVCRRQLPREREQRPLAAGRLPYGEPDRHHGHRNRSPEPRGDRIDDRAMVDECPPFFTDVQTTDNPTIA